jgi:hypothetical protein
MKLILLYTFVFAVSGSIIAMEGKLSEIGGQTHIQNENNNTESKHTMPSLEDWGIRDDEYSRSEFENIANAIQHQINEGIIELKLNILDNKWLNKFISMAIISGSLASKKIFFNKIRSIALKLMEEKRNDPTFAHLKLESFYACVEKIASKRKNYSNIENNYVYYHQGKPYTKMQVGIDDLFSPTLRSGNYKAEHNPYTCCCDMCYRGL